MCGIVGGIQIDAHMRATLFSRANEDIHAKIVELVDACHLCLSHFEQRVAFLQHFLGFGSSERVTKAIERRSTR